MSDERAAIDIGVDLRPLPLKVGDDIWLFNPDPGKEFFGALARAGARLENNRSEEDVNEGLDALRDILSAELTRADQVEEFISRNYGLAVLTALSRVYPEQVTGIPTVPSSGSGQKRPSGGGNASRRG